MVIPIPETSKDIFREAMIALNEAGIPCMIGGAFAMYHYSGMWRNTNDLDFYLERRFIPDVLAALLSVGFVDSGEMAAGDRNWIYHFTRDDVLIDVIWQPPNQLWSVDEGFFERSTEGMFLGTPAHFLPQDMLICSKLLIMNRQRCDWPDLFELVRARYAEIDWDNLLSLLGNDWPALLSFIVLFDWVYPSDVDAIPDELRNELLARKSKHIASPSERMKEILLDPWIYSRPVSP